MSKQEIQPDARVEALRPFVGKWHTEGERLVGSFGPAAKLRAVEVFEWLEGGHFLVHHFSGYFDKELAGCIEIIGRGDEADDFKAKTFYGDGDVQDWQLVQRGSQWLLQGKWRDRQGATLRVRSSMTFEELGNTLVSEWSYSSDGQDWKIFLRSRGTKALPLPDTSIG
jgi:hypothetical protein